MATRRAVWARLAELDRADQGNSAVIGASGRRCSGINHPSTDAARPALSASCYAVVVGRVPYGPGCTWNCSAHAFSPIKLQLKERDDRRANTEDDTVPTVQRWAISPFDLAEHLLSDTPPSGVLKAHAGTVAD
jgi:hypothetical protein